jgi:hypothetical protein
MSRLRFPLLLLLFAAIPTSTYRVQAQTAGDIRGTVFDPQGAVVVNVEVIATNQGTNAKRTTKSNDNGIYEFANMPVGTYRLEFNPPGGFKRQVRHNVEVKSGQTTKSDKNLEIGPVSVIVNETAEPSLIDTTSANVTSAVSQQQITQLPLSSVNPLYLLSTMPGVVVTDRGASINGSRDGSANITRDGVDLNGGENNDPGAAGSQVRQLPADAIGEFSVSSTYSAESRGYGAETNFVTRSGSNDFHGSASYDHRNSKMAARDFFETAKSRFLFHQFVSSLGGRVLRDRIFFFGSYEGTRNLESRTRVISVPSQARLTSARAILAAQNLPESQLSRTLLQFFPSPDRPGDFDNRLINSQATDNSDTALARFDLVPNQHSLLYVSYGWSRAAQLLPVAPSYITGFRTDFTSGQRSLSVTYTTDLPANQSNEARFTYSRNAGASFPEDHAFDPSSVGLNTGVTDPNRFGLPFLKITGFDALGAPVNIPVRQMIRAWQLLDNFSRTIGKHHLKSGINFNRVLVDSRNDSGTRGRINFDGSILGDPLADFLGGLPSGNTGIVRGQTQRATATNSISGYVQDRFSPTRRLFLDLGLRYDFNEVIHEAKDRLSNFIASPAALMAVGLFPVGSQQLPKLYNSDFNNIGPRIGLSWQPIKFGDLVIRGGWGLSYDPPLHRYFVSIGPFSNSLVSGATTNPTGSSPVFAIGSLPSTRFERGVAIFGDPSNPPGPYDLFAVEPSLKTTYAERFSLGAQYQFSRNMAIDIDYVGTKGNHNFRVIDLNQPPPGNPATRDMRRPFFAQFPQFRTINMLISDGKSSFHSFSLVVRRRMSSGLGFDASYTLSKSIDDASSVNELPQDSRNLRAERAPSSFDQRHKVTLSLSYEFNHRGKALLEGFQVTALLVAASGHPFTPVVSLDRSGTGMFMDRPNAVGDRRSAGDKTQLYNPNAFMVPPIGSFGNAGRNSLRGPGLNYFNLAVLKNTKVTENLRFQLRLEFFNLFNHANFASPNTVVDDPGFGTVSATNPFSARRKIQVGARITF